MTTRAIRQQLHNYLEQADDRKVKAMYAIMEDAINEMQTRYSDDFKKELDSRLMEYKKGKAGVVSAAESRKRARKILKTAKGK